MSSSDASTQELDVNTKRRRTLRKRVPPCSSSDESNSSKSLPLRAVRTRINTRSSSDSISSRIARSRILTRSGSSGRESPSSSRERRPRTTDSARSVRDRDPLRGRESPSGKKHKHVRSPSFVFDHPMVKHARTSSYAMYQQSMDMARNTISELDLPASTWCGFFACAMLTVTLGEAVKINNAQPTPYMDEIFHVRQTRHYCAGNWSVWDEKITTLPGLYILTALVAHSASMMKFRNKEPLHWCSVEKLRFVNIMMSVMIFLVMYTIFRKLSRRLKDDPGLGIHPIHRTCCMLNSLVLCCFPLLYFYNLLYYTDVGSVLFVLASYSCSIRNHHLKAALLGGISVMFRQTNIIWVGFTAGTVVIRDIEYLGCFNTHEDFVSQFEVAVRYILRNLGRYLRQLSPYIAVVVAFLAFVVYNGSIVVGDRSAHRAVGHFPQFLYYLLFVTAFSLPHMIQRLQHSHLTVFYYVFKPVHILLFFASALLSLLFFKYEHPYLLSDNRHYTFYIWRKIFNRSASTMYLLLPVCFYTFMNMVAVLATVHSKFFCLLYFVCVAVQIVPQGLLEFRYFLVPYLLYRLHVPQHSWVVLFLELCQYTLVNLITVKIFLNKTFEWEHADEYNPNPQRFMW